MATKAKIAYQEKYNKTPKERKIQTDRRRAERAAVKDGSSPIGDGKDVAHIVAGINGGGVNKSNVKVESAKKNRSWRKGQSGYTVPKDA